MKIAMIGHKRIPSREGGIEIVVEQLGAILVQRGHEVTAYNRRGRHVLDASVEVKQEACCQGIRLKWIRTPEHKSLNALVYSFFATVHAVFGRYDVIHIHAEGPAAMCWLPRLFGKRTIVTIHGLDWQRGKWGGFASAYLKLGEKMAVRYAHEIVVLSRNVQRYFMDTYGRETVYIPNGMEAKARRSPNMIKDKYGLEEAAYLLFLGRLVPEKGVHYLIEAYRKLDTRVPLIIAGAASHSSEYYQELVKLVQGDERIVFTGFVQGQELEELYSNCLAYVLPSDVEGMPISLLEAMSFGRTCITSDIPEITEVIGEKAFVFPHGEVDALAETMKEVLSSAPQALERSYAEEMKQYDWNEIAGQHINIYGKEG